MAVEIFKSHFSQWHSQGWCLKAQPQLILFSAQPTDCNELIYSNKIVKYFTKTRLSCQHIKLKPGYAH